MYGAYWLDLRAYDPLKTAAKLKIPILIVQGGRDYQVTPSNFQAWSDALSNNKNVTLRTYPDLDHLFIHGTGASKPSDYARLDHVSARSGGRASRHSFCRARSRVRSRSRTEPHRDLTAHKGTKSEAGDRVANSRRAPGSDRPFAQRAICTGDDGVWYSWLAHSALSPEDAHTLVSFTATGKTAGAS